MARWLDRPRHKPLVIRGPRQVGKSTLVRMLAQSSGRRLVEINLERHPNLDQLFAGFNVTEIERGLEALLGERIAGSGEPPILFLDEIQATPHALQALRYFYEDRPDLPVVAAGSLREFALGETGLSMPVGRVEYMHLFPLTFEEFLGALEEDVLKEALCGIGSHAQSCESDEPGFLSRAVCARAVCAT